MARLNLAILMIFLTATMAQSIDFKTGDRVIIGEADTVGSDLFVGAQYLDARGYINGDIYAGCERISIDGEVRDDVRAGGREIIVRGRIGDGVIAFGQIILIDGDVTGDVIAYGGEVRVSGNIGGNLYIGSGKFFLEGGQIGGKIEGSADESDLNGVVEGPVKLKGGKVTFGNGYKAGKGTFLTLTREPDPEMKVNAPEYLEISVVPPKPFYQKMYFYWAFGAAFVLGLLLILVVKNFMQNYVTAALKQVGLNFGIGILILIATPIAVVILLILVLTIPTAIVLLLAYLVLLYVSTIFASLAIGEFIQKLLSKKSDRILVLSLLIGLIVSTMLAEAPYVGGLFSLAIICYGTGSFSRYVWGFRKPAKMTRK